MEACVKGTRLWQEARSPLISGRSKRERPFWREVLGGWTIAVLLVALFAYVTTLSGSPGNVSVNGVEVPRALLALVGGSAFAVFPALVGSIAGAWLAKMMGWKRPWVSAAATGVLFGVLWLAFSAIDLGSR